VRAPNPPRSDEGPSDRTQNGRQASRRVRRLCEVACEIGAGAGPELARLVAFRDRYLELSVDERAELFEALANQVEVGPSRLTEPACRLLATDPGDIQAWSQAVSTLRRGLASPRRELLARLLNLPGGMAFVLNLRADVLDAVRNGRTGAEVLDEDLAELLGRLFRQGFLTLAEIDQHAPFRTIRFLKEHELVHPMTALEEMGRRLGRDRRCYALCHVAMPEEPVLFVEVALARGMVRSIHEILGAEEPTGRGRRVPDTAIFYSINNTQNGLAGLGLGALLVYQVTDALRRAEPGLRTFATLSPIPGFWPEYLRPILAGERTAAALTRDGAIERFPRRSREVIVARRATGDDFGQALVELLDDPSWPHDTALVRCLRGPLTALAYHYVAHEQDRRGRPLNPVANFHLGNGATIRQGDVNLLADLSPRGVFESCTLMANYIYSGTWFREIRLTVNSLIRWAGA